VLERLLLFVAAIGPIALLLTGIAVIGVGLAWAVTKAIGPRR
jgi:hypothetical protein